MQIEAKIDMTWSAESHSSCEYIFEKKACLWSSTCLWHDIDGAGHKLKTKE